MESAAGGLLDDCDDDRKRRESEKEQRLHRIAKGQIDEAGAEQQAEHRLAQHIAQDARQPAPAGAGKFIWPFGREPRQRFAAGQAPERRIHAGNLREYRIKPS
jgi:hypothetical protein